MRLGNLSILDQGAREPKIEFQRAIDGLRTRLNPDVRHQIQGHDLIALLNFVYSEAAKRKALPNGTAVRTALTACAGMERIRGEQLFATLVNRAG